MAAVYTGPLPTRLIPLSELSKYQAGAKVRFLGCVTRYKISSAELTLEHNHPRGSTAKAVVDVNLLVTTMKSTDTRIGEWVNVIGYIQKSPPESQSAGATLVQAIVLWSAGSVKLDDYEEVLDSLGNGT